MVDDVVDDAKEAQAPLNQAPVNQAPENQSPMKKRLLWFAALWFGSLIGFAALVYGGKWLFNALGRIFVS